MRLPSTRKSQSPTPALRSGHRRGPSDKEGSSGRISVDYSILLLPFVYLFRSTQSVIDGILHAANKDIATVTLFLIDLRTCSPPLPCCVAPSSLLYTRTGTLFVWSSLDTFFFCGRCINARTRFQILSVTCVETRFCFLGRVLKEATCVEIQFCSSVVY